MLLSRFQRVGRPYRNAYHDRHNMNGRRGHIRLKQLEHDDEYCGMVMAYGNPNYSYISLKYEFASRKLQNLLSAEH